jgi:large subunit ribosomal protein L15
VNLDSLVKDGIVTSPKHPLKVLGNGELTVKLTIQASAFTASARTKIEAAGGSCEII